MIQHLGTLIGCFFSFKNRDKYTTKNYFVKYDMPFVEIKQFNTLIDNKPFFNQHVKNKQEPYQKLNEM